MRVVHVIRNLHDGGMERIVADLLISMAGEREADLHVISLQPGGRYAATLSEHVPITHVHGGSRLSLLRPTHLAKAIRRLSPDIVHTHSGTWYKAAYAARIAGVQRIVYTEHGRHFPDPPINRLIDRMAALLSTSVVVVSASLGSYMNEALGIPTSKIQVILNGISLPQLPDPLSPSAEHLSSSDAVTFLTVGRIEPVKGLELLIEALSRWPPSAPPARLLVAGDGSSREGLQRRAEAAGLDDRVRFLGWIERPMSLYQSADVYVLPSHSEGTSISLLEAMATGCPPIASAVGGNVEVLGDRLASWLFPSGDAAALLTRMVSLASSPELRAEVGEQAKARVQEAYSLQRMAERYLQLYEQLMMGSTRPRH